MKLDLAVVIVTYNNRKLLDRCLESVLASSENVEKNVAITVVDNASNDGTDELLESKYKDRINYIRNSKNYGLAKALNIGIKENIGADYLMLMNDDVELFSDTLKKMLERLEENRDVYGIPARLIYPDGTPQRMKLKIVGVNKSIPEEVRVVSFAGTTACMYRSEAFRIVGFFDEFYFFYNEDLDFSIRAKRKGVKFLFDPSIKVIHHRKKGRVKAEKEIKPYFYATDYYFYRKNFGRLFSSVYLLMAIYHIKRHIKLYKKNSDDVKLSMLNEAKEKLFQTIKNYRRLVKGV